jgi:hypothetical protein
MYIDEGSSAPLEAIGKSVEAFAASAASGQFAVNEAGGDALLAAIRTMSTWLRDNQEALNTLAQQPRLGSSKAAKTMAPYVANVASDEQGFLTQLAGFDASLKKAEAAIKQAMANYQDTDRLNEDKLR